MIIEQSLKDFEDLNLNRPSVCISAADALHIRSVLMRSGVPLAALPRTGNLSSYVPREDRSVISNTRDVTVEIINHKKFSRKASIDHVAGASTCTVDTADHEVPSLRAPPPTRTVTPMLSFYATVKISNIRMLVTLMAY